MLLNKYKRLTTSQLQQLAKESTSAKELDKLTIANSGKNDLVVYDVAANPHASVNTIERIALQARDYYVHVRIAHLPIITTKIIDHYSKTSDRWVIEALASNPVVPVDRLELLFANKKAHSGLARNTNLPIALLETLASHENYEIREAVASNPSTPLTILERLAQDETVNVVYEVSRNPSTPRELLLDIHLEHLGFIESSYRTEEDEEFITKVIPSQYYEVFDILLESGFKGTLRQVLDTLVLITK